MPGLRDRPLCPILHAKAWRHAFLTKPDYYIHILRRMYAENSYRSIRFTDADLSPGNIMVDKGHVMGILDWQEAGWYPEY